MAKSSKQKARKPERLMVTVEVDQELREAVNAASDAEFRTVAAWVRIAIREKLQRTAKTEAA